MQAKINKFIQTYADKNFKHDLNVIHLSKMNSIEHNLRVCEVCIYLLKNDIPFITEFRMNCGLRPDIVVPTHIKPIIEVFHSEDDKKFMEKKFNKLPDELKNEVIFISTNKVFIEKDIM